LLYYRESEIIALGKELGLHPLKNPCQYDGHTQRQSMKELIPAAGKTIPGPVRPSGCRHAGNSRHGTVAGTTFAKRNGGFVPRVLGAEEKVKN
jgi:hypothetical protein